MQELEIEAFTCTVLRCVKEKTKEKNEKMKKKNSSFAETSKGFYYCSIPLVAQLTLVQASASLTIEMACSHSARYICITVTLYAGCVRNKLLETEWAREIEWQGSKRSWKIENERETREIECNVYTSMNMYARMRALCVWVWLCGYVSEVNRQRKIWLI